MKLADSSIWREREAALEVVDEHAQFGVLLRLPRSTEEGEKRAGRHVACECRFLIKGAQKQVGHQTLTHLAVYAVTSRLLAMLQG